MLTLYFLVILHDLQLPILHVLAILSKDKTDTEAENEDKAKIFKNNLFQHKPAW